MSFLTKPNVRVYAEMIDAESNWENVAPRPIEVNRVDMLNLFADATLIRTGCRDFTVRVGRQELLYGEQRVISPLDWANTRRTFEGAKLMWKGPQWGLDAFWTNPVRVDDHSFDSPDRDQEFMGLYATRAAANGSNLDLYMLRHLNGRGNNNFQFNTVGIRFDGKHCDWLWAGEAGYQFGDNSDGSDHAAGSLTFGGGRTLSSHCWKPTLWLYYDWASGDNDLGAGNGYHHQFPLAHKYFGFMDLFGRRNIQDINFLWTAQPADNLKLLVWYHYLRLANANDSPYSVVMTPFNGNNAPGSSDLGHEIDLVATWSLHPRSNLLFGYSHFFSGEYYQRTAGVPFSGDADFFYSQFSVNF